MPGPLLGTEVSARSPQNLQRVLARPTQEAHGSQGAGVRSVPGSREGGGVLRWVQCSMQIETACFWSGWAQVPPSSGTLKIRGLQRVAAKPPSSEGSSHLSHPVLKGLCEECFPGQSKSQGQQAVGSMLPALNRSESGLVESLQRRMGHGLECFKESSVVYCLTAYANL